MLPISTVLSQDFVQISETKCEGRSDWGRFCVQIILVRKNEVFVVPLSFCGRDIKHTKILRNSFDNLTNMYGNHACNTLETEINLNYIRSSSSYRAVNTPRPVFWRHLLVLLN
jgi:hypothetical protein